MDCISFQNLLPALKFRTEDKTYLTFEFFLQYNLVRERIFFVSLAIKLVMSSTLRNPQKMTLRVFAKDALEDYSHKLQRGITLLNQFRLTSHLLLIERAENSDSGRLTS